MKATVALSLLGLCIAVPVQQRQDDPGATFTTMASTPQLALRQVLPSGSTTSRFSTTGGSTTGPRGPQATPPRGGGQQPGNAGQVPQSGGRPPNQPGQNPNQSGQSSQGQGQGEGTNQGQGSNLGQSSNQGQGQNRGSSQPQESAHSDFAPRDLRLPPYGGPPLPVCPPCIGGRPPFIGGHGPPCSPGNRPPIRPDGSSPPPPPPPQVIA